MHGLPGSLLGFFLDGWDWLAGWRVGFGSTRKRFVPSPKTFKKQRHHVAFLHVLSWARGLCACLLLFCIYFLEKYISEVCFLILAHYFLVFLNIALKIPCLSSGYWSTCHYFVHARKSWLVGVLLGFFWMAGWLVGFGSTRQRLVPSPGPLNKKGSGRGRNWR